MSERNFMLHDTELKFFNRFLENRLPNRIVDGGVHVYNSVRMSAAEYVNEKLFKNFTSSVFPDIKYEYIALPGSANKDEIDANNNLISRFRTRNLPGLKPEWTIEKCEKLIHTAGFTGFSLFCNKDDITGAEVLTLSDCYNKAHIALLNKYEKALYIRLPEKMLLSDKIVGELKELRSTFPDIKIVISGFWGCESVADFMAGSGKFGGSLNAFYFDTSAVVDSGIYNAAIDTIDSDRIIFSTGLMYNYPDNTFAYDFWRGSQSKDQSCAGFVYRQLKSLLDAVGNDDELKQKIFIENAESAYSLAQGQDTMGGKRVTLKDVAQSSGYSLRTVKKVMGGKEYVSDKVRQKVLSAGKELGYTKNKIASALAKNQIHKIAVVYTETSKYFFPEVRTGFENCIKDYQDFGIEVEFFISKESTSGLSSMQTNLLKELNLRNDIEGIVIHPFNSDELTHEINELEAAGKAVVTFVTDAPDSKRLCYVGSGGWKSGRIAAQLMGNYLGCKGRVGIFNTVSNHWQSVNREEGFISKMRDSFPDIELVEPDYHNLLTEGEYYRYVGDMLREGNFDGVFTTSANVYLIGQLFKEIGNKNTTVIGFDLSEETKQLLIDGYIDVIIFQNPELQAYESLKMLCDYILDGIEPRSGSVYTDVSIITSESL